jgi:hypothetical protein
MAIKEGMIGLNDYIFKAYTMPKANKAKKEKLNEQELKNFSDVKLDNNSMSKVGQQAIL